MTISVEYRSLTAGDEVAGVTKKTAGKEEEFFVWNILAERDKMHLVVTTCEASIGAVEAGRVI